MPKDLSALLPDGGCRRRTRKCFPEQRMAGAGPPLLYDVLFTLYEEPEKAFAHGFLLRNLGLEAARRAGMTGVDVRLLAGVGS